MSFLLHAGKWLPLSDDCFAVSVKLASVSYMTGLDLTVCVAPVPCRTIGGP